MKKSQKKETILLKVIKKKQKEKYENKIKPKNDSEWENET